MATALGLLLPSVNAQIVHYEAPQASGVSFKVNVPSSTVSSGSGPIFFQLQGPTSLRYLALAQGSQMAGANMFIMYAASETNITLSPRLGFGHEPPFPNPKAQVSLLDGTGIKDGMMTANVRCDDCLSWTGGSEDLTSTSAAWIYSMLHGHPMNTANTSQPIMVHDTYGGFEANIVAATGGDSQNPFLDSSLSVSSATALGMPNFAGAKIWKVAHAVILCLVFVILFPSFALTLHLYPSRKTVPYIHGPLQLLALILALVGLAFGIATALVWNSLGGFHEIIGIVAVTSLVIFQPLMGLMQHINWRRFAKKTMWGYVHRWFGRLVIILGMINGGLGLYLAHPGSTQAPWSGVIAYSVITGAVAVFYITVVIVRDVRGRRGQETPKSTGSSEKVNTPGEVEQQAVLPPKVMMM